MTKLQKLQLEQSEKREALNKLLDVEPDQLTEEQRSEMAELTARLRTIEPEIRAATVVDQAELETAEALFQGQALSPEQRERIELRSRATVTGYLSAQLSGKQLAGAEAELQQAAGVDGIPLELWDVPETRQSPEQRTVSPAPSTVGVNLDVIRPAIFSPSVAPKLMIDMPQVPTGTYASGTVATSLTASAKGKGEAADQTAAAITVGTTVPHRITGSLALAIEDVAAVGQANFEAVLRENISLVLSDALDNQILNGDGTGDNLSGIFQRLTDPAAPESGVETWARFLAVQASGIDGLWATMLSHIGLLVNPKTYRLAASTFRDSSADANSAAGYMMKYGSPEGGFFTSNRMPAEASDLSQAILCRKGRPGLRTAVCPTWGSIGIDDIYTGATKGERYFTLAVLVGDVIVVQPGAYAQVNFRTSE